MLIYQITFRVFGIHTFAYVTSFFAYHANSENVRVRVDSLMGSVQGHSHGSAIANTSWDRGAPGTRR